MFFRQYLGNADKKYQKMKFCVGKPQTNSFAKRIHFLKMLKSISLVRKSVRVSADKEVGWIGNTGSACGGQALGSLRLRQQRGTAIDVICKCKDNNNSWSAKTRTRVTFGLRSTPRLRKRCEQNIKQKLTAVCVPAPSWKLSLICIIPQFLTTVLDLQAYDPQKKWY